MATQTRIHLFETAVPEAAEWVRDVQRETALDDDHYAFIALRSTLQALRDELTADLIAHVSAQLPTLLRGVYYEGWDPSRTPADDTTAEAFLDRIRPEFMGYGRRYDLVEIVRATVRVVFRRMPGVMTHVQGTINRNVRETIFGRSIRGIAT